MRFSEGQSLRSEIHELERMLHEIPAEDVLDRRSVEARLREVRRQLPIDAEVESRSRAKAILTFRGRPVVGSHGIAADFGSKATGAFTDAVAAIAASLNAPLAPAGPIPDRANNQLLITGTAVGSFGFELEAAAPPPLLLDQASNVEIALTKAIAIFSASSSEDNAQLADTISDVDRRALQKVRTFMQTLAENEATCALSFARSSFRFDNTGQVTRSVERLSETNIATDTREILGAFSGAIPSQRTFEFISSTLGSPVVGKIGAEIDPTSINQILGRQKVARFIVTRVGNGPEKYLLEKIIENDPPLLTGMPA